MSCRVKTINNPRTTVDSLRMRRNSFSFVSADKTLLQTPRLQSSNIIYINIWLTSAKQDMRENLNSLFIYLLLFQLLRKHDGDSNESENDDNRRRDKKR